ncbi:MAG: histidine phosphatase family protein [Gammaproteobacteria bacterium]|nr:histidine phosphatase family protein [Gammaproteobacteria bacterium]
MELILIRHGLPEKIINEDGSPADPPLSVTGHEQAAKMADWMQTEQIDRLYSSPMQRAYQTAEPLARMLSREIEVREGVAEYDQNAENYIPVEELKEVDYERWLRLMRGETEVDFDEFAYRVISELEGIIADNQGKRVAVTCHGGVINVWAAHVVGFQPRLFFNPNYTSINRFMAASSGEKSVITLNEAYHLRPANN